MARDAVAGGFCALATVNATAVHSSGAKADASVFFWITEMVLITAKWVVNFGFPSLSTNRQHYIIDTGAAFDQYCPEPGEGHALSGL